MTPPTTPDCKQDAPGVIRCADIVRCIDDTLDVLVARLEAKQPMYLPDAEWNAIMQTCESLRAAKRDIARYIAPNEKLTQDARP